MNFKAIHWDDDEYVISGNPPGAIGMTLHKEDADIVAQWLNDGGYKALLSLNGCTCEKGADVDHWSKCKVHGFRGK